MKDLTDLKMQKAELNAKIASNSRMQQLLAKQLDHLTSEMLKVDFLIIEHCDSFNVAA